ncbi:MSEP-CTERM sorting domain-containing protein [Hymenobacter lapidiphilus]|uniref:MSEP-CTERM sorting domain-containing protein n=1 Tax=Hymenobacter lapidiphilus TaxID=2608003 RepID=A0A7Y7PNV5_9BACT|nr:MSEP-CTERM sorting domain-containing protein [Hymenobacter lapidiphilus]NVO31281.1 MSEP-CTERM sorting domain-containing protein [Hymenobacter lapidiphilus]
MRSLLNPRWLWLLNTLPVALLLLFFGAEYKVIRSLLEPASRLAWQWLGAVLLGLVLAHAAYAGWLAARRRQLPIGYALAALGLYIGLLYSYGTQVDRLFPFSVPRWMVPADLPLYAGTFLMPTLAHAAAVLVLRLTPENREFKALPNFGAALAVPTVGYLFAQLVLPLWHYGSGPVTQHVLVVLLITGTLLFLLALSRGVYILARRRTANKTFRWVGLLLVAGVLPLVGLAVNNGELGVLGRGQSAVGIFGDFSDPWWYGLAGLNALLLLWSNPVGFRWRLVLLLGRAALFGYTLYFFLVFLPFLPLSVVAVLLLGSGFLLLAPLVLFIVHVRVLSEDYAALRLYFGRRGLLAGLLAAGSVLPLAVAGQYAWHRATLHRALNYVYQPDYFRPVAPVDTTVLRAVLGTVRHHKNTRSASITGARLPYLSSFYNWVVLDNLTLPESKMELLEQVFLAEEPVNQPQSETETADEIVKDVARDTGSPPAAPTAPRLTQLAARSRYVARQRIWVSWVDLTIINPDSNANFAEYTTRLPLPAGCFVSNYYLDMAGRREYGILAEKRAATWVYRQIRAENRDPGLLSYRHGNELDLRVFPLAAGEVRRTGLELLHPEPLTLQLDGQSVQLGEARPGTALPPETGLAGGATYVSAAQKAALPLVRRQPYYHFLVDNSIGRQGSWAAYRQMMVAVVRPAGPSDERSEYSLVGSRTTPFRRPEASRTAKTNLPVEGGFYLDRAIRQTLVRAAETPASRYPVLVVVSADFRRAILPANFADLRHTFPESAFFYELLPDGRLVSHSLLHDPAAPLDTLMAPDPASPVVAWPNPENATAYLPANGQPELVLDSSPVSPQQLTALAPHNWHSGLVLQASWRHQLHHPETGEAAGRQLVEASFRTGLLTPLTAYLALENDAQKAALRRKQAEMLNGHAALEAEEDQRMSEPGDWLLLLLGAALAAHGWWRHRRPGPVAA